MDAITDADVEAWRSAVGRTQVQEARLSTEPLRRFALAIGLDPDGGSPPPVLSHWAYFLETGPDGDLGEDGHPRRGAFLPAISLPRRMFAGADIRLHQPLDLEQTARMTLTIADVAHKRGRGGDLVFVEVERRLEQGGQLKVEERRSLVYRGFDPVGAPLPAPSPTSIEGELWAPSSTHLFRFSAATFNSHRIHYDAAYAAKVEGYPALVVHGPFAAARLAQFAQGRGPLSRFSFKSTAPLFVGQPIRLRFAGPQSVEAVRCDGAVATRAEVVYG